jgi:predicted ATP-dependent endonuclease of OLD family
MILLSFFLNEVDRRKTEEGLADIIYAFEEPETSQHPNHQEILVNAFNELSNENGVQVILTTHSPYIYKEFTKKDDINLIYI